MIKIIADDLGLHKSVNDGIIFLLKQNKISGASLMASGIAFNDAVEQIKKLLDPSIGIHLVLVEEKSMLPVAHVPSLLGSGGLLHKDHRIFFLRYILGLIKKDEVKNEWEAQIKKCVDAGITLSFLNSHQHLHLLPSLMDIAIELAKKYKIHQIRIVREPITSRGSIIRKLQLIVLIYLSRAADKKIKKAGLECNDYFIGFLGAGSMGINEIRIAGKLSQQHPDLCVELGCHPGLENEELRNSYRHWGYNWENELAVLKSNK